MSRVFTGFKVVDANKQSIARIWPVSRPIPRAEESEPHSAILETLAADHRGRDQDA